jgi:CheY-like chemotaxis protein
MPSRPPRSNHFGSVWLANCRGIRNALEDRQDWQICDEAADGQQAVNKVNTLRPDLVIVDINMPVLNGLAAVRQILRNRPQTKIVIFTVHDSEQPSRKFRPRARTHTCRRMMLATRCCGWWKICLKAREWLRPPLGIRQTETLLLRGPQLAQSLPG